MRGVCVVSAWCLRGVCVVSAWCCVLRVACCVLRVVCCVIHFIYKQVIISLVSCGV